MSKKQDFLLLRKEFNFVSWTLWKSNESFRIIIEWIRTFRISNSWSLRNRKKKKMKKFDDEIKWSENTSEHLSVPLRLLIASRLVVNVVLFSLTWRDIEDRGAVCEGRNQRRQTLPLLTTLAGNSNQTRFAARFHRRPAVLVCTRISARD